MENTRVYNGPWGPEKIRFVKSLQRARVVMMLSLIGLTAIELSLMIIYFHVMPIFLIIFNAVCIMVNGFLFIALIDVYRIVKDKLNKYKI